MKRLAATSLPFLFKVLSVRTALSIQAHPDKALAQKLHVRYPDQYKDDNHKPEMSVAITPFEALCSFQPAYSILENLRATPELVALVGEAVVSALDDATNARAAAARGGEEDRSGAGFRRALQALFRALMTAPAERVAAQLDALTRRIHCTSEMLRTPIDVLAMRLHEQYPGDVGVFCAYLLNYVELQPGEALFMGANEPHAYISGDCAEVMATSDNVVRAGLTPKWKDVESLCEMLTYTDGAPRFVHPTQALPAEPYVWRYAPPREIDEFVLERVELPAAASAAVATLPATDGLAVLLVVSGSVHVEQLDSSTDDAVGLRHRLSAGAVHLVCPHTILRIKLAPDAGHHGGQPALLFRAAARQIGDDMEADLDGGAAEPPSVRIE